MTRRIHRGTLGQINAPQRLAAVLVVGSLAAAFAVPVFATPLNLSQVLTQMSINGIMVVGMTILLISGGVDLSIGSTLALGGVVFALSIGAGVVPALLISILAGALVGALNGFLVTVGRINFFIATLATMVGVKGLALTLSAGQTIYGSGTDFTWLGSAGLSLGPFELQTPALIFITAALVGAGFLRWTQTGRNFYALGGNRQASFLAGVPVDRTFFTAFVLMGTLAGLAGAMLASRTSSGSAVVGSDTALVVISAAVLGGTSIYGGIGSILGAVIGLVVLSVLDNVLLLLAVPSFYIYLIRGAVLVAVVVTDAQIALRREATSPERTEAGEAGL